MGELLADAETCCVSSTLLIGPQYVIVFLFKEQKSLQKLL